MTAMRTPLCFMKACNVKFTTAAFFDYDKKYCKEAVL